MGIVDLTVERNYVGLAFEEDSVVRADALVCLKLEDCAALAQGCLNRTYRSGLHSESMGSSVRLRLTRTVSGASAMF